MPTIPRRDALASLMIVVVLAIQLPFVALGNRATGCLSLLAIGAVVLLLAGAQRPDFTGWLATVLAVAAAVTGTVAISRPSSLLSAIAIGSVLTLWCVNLTEHLTFETSDPREQLGPATRR
jgi:hypothetical protein